MGSKIGAAYSSLGLPPALGIPENPSDVSTGLKTYCKIDRS